jgi:uncharacterized protein (TIGR00297 family)
MATDERSYRLPISQKMNDFVSIILAWSFAGAVPRQLWITAAVTVAFTALARWLRGVTRSGAAAGAVVCFLLYAGAGLGAFLGLVSVFALTWITTRWGYQRKQRLGTAEKRDGRRASQVLANLGLAGVCALFHSISRGQAIYLLAMAAALSEAAADTVSSELGQAIGQQARLITNWKPVPAGTDGGISPAGTFAGIAAATVVSSVCGLSGVLPWRWLVISILSGVAGMLADSYMGAWLERRRLLNNDSVNFLGTLVAAGVALLLA